MFVINYKLVEIFLSIVLVVTLSSSAFIFFYIVANYPERQVIAIWRSYANDYYKLQSYIEKLLNFFRKTKEDNNSKIYYNEVNVAYQRLNTSHDYQYHLQVIKSIQTKCYILAFLCIGLAIGLKTLLLLPMALICLIGSLFAQKYCDKQLVSRIKFLNKCISFELSTFASIFACNTTQKSILAIMQEYLPMAGAFKTDIKWYLTSVHAVDNSIIGTLDLLVKRMQMTAPVDYLPKIISAISKKYTTGDADGIVNFTLETVASDILDDANEYLGTLCTKGCAVMQFCVMGSVLLAALMVSLPLLMDLVRITEVL